jgi:hypothetical protein
MKLLLMHFSPESCSLHTLRPQYLRKRLIAKYPQQSFNWHAGYHSVKVLNEIRTPQVKHVGRALKYNYFCDMPFCRIRRYVTTWLHRHRVNNLTS